MAEISGESITVKYLIHKISLENLFRTLTTIENLAVLW